jgi:hypothetical protein
VVLEPQWKIIIRVIHNLSELWWNIKISFDVGGSTFFFSGPSSLLGPLFHVADTTLAKLAALGRLHLLLLPLFELPALSLSLVLAIHFLLFFLGAVARGQLIQEDLVVIVYFQGLDVFRNV